MSDDEYLERLKDRNYGFRLFRQGRGTYNAFRQDPDGPRGLQDVYPRGGRRQIFRTITPAPAVSSRGRDTWDNFYQKGKNDLHEKKMAISSSRKSLRESFRDLPVNFGPVVGSGGYGVAIKCRKLSPQGAPSRWFVIKVSLDKDKDIFLIREKESMITLRSAAHCVQIMNPGVLGDFGSTVTRRATRRRGQEPVKRLRQRVIPDDDDSSWADDFSSGDATPDTSQHAATPQSRLQMLRDFEAREEHDNKRRAFDARWREFNDKANSDSKPKRPEFIIMELVEHGELGSLIARIAEKIERDCLSGTGEGKRREEFVPEGIRTPNRVLWSFWLCLVRACVALEYPPKRFHPDRRKLDPWVAKKRGTYREAKFLGPLREDNLLRDDPAQLLEEIPEDRRLREKGYRMVHFDFDPSNVLIGRFDGEEPEKYGVKEPPEATRKEKKQQQQKKKKKKSSTKGPDKVSRKAGSKRKRTADHYNIPRLKLGDFGLTKRVKSNKSNQYYELLRQRGKHNYYAPEQFAEAWEHVDATNPLGGEHADDSFTSSFGSPMNVFSAAYTLWTLITCRIPPQLGPRPQVPPEVWPQYSASRGEIDLDAAIEQYEKDNNTHVKVSYCPWIWNPVEGVKDSDYHTVPGSISQKPPDYQDVDDELRKTIYECMYHFPEDRPSLEALLEQAKRGVRKEYDHTKYDTETDEAIEQWVKYWILDPAPQEANSSADEDENDGDDDEYNFDTSED